MQTWEVGSFTASVNDQPQRTIAYRALAVYAAILLLIIWIGWLWQRQPLDDVIKVLTTFSSIVSGIIGAIVGYYFNSRSRNS